MPNITVHIEDEELVRRAKAVAALRGTSVSQMVRTFLKREVNREQEKKRAKQVLAEHMEPGYHLGGTPLSREEVHERTVD